METPMDLQTRLRHWVAEHDKFVAENRLSMPHNTLLYVRILQRLADALDEVRMVDAIANDATLAHACSEAMRRIGFAVFVHQVHEAHEKGASRPAREALSWSFTNDFVRWLKENDPHQGFPIVGDA